VEPEPVEAADRDEDWKTSWDIASGNRPASDPSAAFPSRKDLEPVARQVDDARSSRHGSNGSADDQGDPSRSEANTTLPEAVREIQQARPSGRRRRAEDDDDVIPASTPEPAPRENPEPVATPSGGRRRRPEGEPPAWEELAEPEPVNGSRHLSNGSSGSSRAANGSHLTSEPAERNGSGGRRAAAARGTRYDEQEPADIGSRAAGRSVAELLAANGAGDVTPRRRRRAED
jgi:hypothetical protein